MSSGYILRVARVVNKGGTTARNDGLKTASIRFIAFYDADDAWLPNKLSTHLSCIISKDIACWHTSYLLCNDSVAPLKVVHAKRLVRLSDTRFVNEIGNFTGLYNSQKLRKFFQSEGAGHEDYAMSIDFLRHADSVNVLHVLAECRK